MKKEQRPEIVSLRVLVEKESRHETTYHERISVLVFSISISI